MFVLCLLFWLSALLKRLMHGEAKMSVAATNLISFYVEEANWLERQRFLSSPELQTTQILLQGVEDSTFASVER